MDSPGVSNPKGAIRQALLNAIAEGDPAPASTVARRFSVTRQGVNRHLRDLVAKSLVVATGSTRSRRYQLVETTDTRSYTLTGLSEDTVWTEFVAPKLTSLPTNLQRIWHHGVTEMVNNSVEHSGGRKVTVGVDLSPVFTRVTVYDDGVGIFLKVKEAAQLEDERLAALELAKGKFTTDPANHSGEGIFFTSRIFDKFSILSHRLVFYHDPRNEDWLMEDKDDQGPGTQVSMLIANSSTRTVSEVFEKFASPTSDFRFNVTHVPVGLARIGSEHLVSRSQAKRVLDRLERFDKVLLDFEGVDSIGQAFADEAFRVFPLSNPGTKISWINATPEVQRMILRVEAERETSGRTSRQPD